MSVKYIVKGMRMDMRGQPGSAQSRVSLVEYRVGITIL